MRTLWLLLALVTAIGANTTTVSQGLVQQGPELEPSSKDCMVFIGKWTTCTAGDGDHFKSVDRRTQQPNTDSLVHTPRLGLQRRQLLCRYKDERFVESIYCPGIASMGAVRVCVMQEDCSLGEWLPWQPRSDGALVRTRRVRRLPQGGGKECELVEEVRPAVLEVSAHWTPGPWGSCKVTVEHPATSPANEDDDDADDNDAIYEEDDESDEVDSDSPSSCGGGVQRREATCVRADGRALLPTHCAYLPMPTLVQPCEVPCPRDCEVGEWSEWGACQPADGCPLYPVQQLTTTGYSVRRRRVTAAASGGGAPCPPLEEKRACNTPRCAAWSALPWGPCVLSQPHAVCGPGRRTRELRCVGHDGKESQRALCNGSGAPARSERCRIACPGDCVVSAWGGWGACSAACAAPSKPRPTRTRRRHILAHATPSGWPCPLEDQLVQNETCNTHACATYSWLATPWGPCERRKDDFTPSNNYTDLLDGEPYNESDDEEPCVEEGEMIRDVMCVQNNADVVREALCAPLRRPSSRRSCTVRCRRGCRVEAWMPWSPCPNTCEPGKQVRVRRVHGGPNCGPLQEARDCPVPRACRSRATWAAGEWSTCRLPPATTCGIGYRIRSIWCGSDSHRIEAGTCAGQLVPPSVAPCQVPCGATKTLTCDVICADPLKYLDSSELDVPSCVCKNVSLELLQADSDCIMPPGLECGEGRALRAARCLTKYNDQRAIVPMDVCRKYHPLTGPRRVREASTDGLTYDEEITSLLRAPCTVRCARDCAVGPWAAWGPCAAESDSRTAFRFRTREVIEEGSAGGRECGATLQRATCTVPEPRWSSGEWSVCAPRDALCGRAVINRTVECVDGSGGRLPEVSCVSAGPKPVHEAVCRAPCPSDCVVSAWSDWSPCDQTKWGGRRDRTRVVLRPAEEGGVPCPHLVGAEPCAPHTYSWHVAPWDDCQPLGGSPCGEGTKKRSVRCLRSDGTFVEDTFCPNATSSEARESWCYVPCGVDCEVGEWGAWDATACRCEDTANVKHMRRIRQHLTAAVWPGRACPPTEQRAPCPRDPCLRLLAQSLPGCTLLKSNGDEDINSCGWGVTQSTARCEFSGPLLTTLHVEPWRCVSALPGRIVMPPNSQQEDEVCRVECGCKQWEVGRPGPWGLWSPCRNGTRSRTKQMILPPGVVLCKNSHRFVVIQQQYCREDANDANDLDETSVYPDGYIAGSTSVLLVVWTATICLTIYGTFMIYRGIIRCLRSRKVKSVAKV